MILTDQLYAELLEYLASRPWREANALITKLVQAKQADKPAIRDPKPIASKEK